MLSQEGHGETQVRRSPRKGGNGARSLVLEPVEEVDDSSSVSSADLICKKNSHAKSKWMELKDYDDPYYVKDKNGRFYKAKCAQCKCMFVHKNAGEGQTLWSRDNPARVCQACTQYAVCRHCYLIWLNANSKQDKNDNRLAVRMTRSRR
jgi:hypothetical protein